MPIFAVVPRGEGVKGLGLSTTTLLGYFGGYFSGTLEGQHCLRSADKDQQESCAVAGKPHDAIVIFDVSKFTAALHGSPCDTTAFLYWHT